MKKEMQKIDELIKEALSVEEAKFYDELEEQNLWDKLSSIHRGKLGWLAMIMNIVNLLIFGLFVYCLVKFINTEEISELIKWASAGFLCMTTVVMTKLFMWMQMDKNDILREMKRLELQISVLTSKLNK